MWILLLIFASRIRVAHKFNQIEMNNSSITAIGVYHPYGKIDNAFFESRLDTTDEWIRERTGIESRYFVAADEYTGDMCVNAALDMKKKFNVDFEDVDFIIVASMTPDQTIPNVASQVQTRLGIRNTGAVDICTACSGFCYGLIMAKGLIASGAYRKILVFGADTMSRIVDFNDRNTCILFGDAAGCVLVERSEENGLFEPFSGTDGSMGKDLYLSSHKNSINGAEISADGKVHQNGRAVYKWAVTTLSEGLGTLAAKNGISLDDVDIFLPHSANYRMLEAVFKSLGVPMDKCIDSVRKYGNTSAASIPMAWYEGLRSGHIRQGDTLMLIGFGAGFTYAGLCLRNGIDGSRIAE